MKIATIDLDNKKRETCAIVETDTELVDKSKILLDKMKELEQRIAQLENI